MYWIAQLPAASSAASSSGSSSKRGDLDTTGVFAANGWGADIGSQFGLGSTAVVEIVFTALLVFVVLSTTTVGYPTGFGGVAAGLTLTMIHLATIPVDNTSVNPARSLGTAVFSGHRRDDSSSGRSSSSRWPERSWVSSWMVVHDTRLEPARAVTRARMLVRRGRSGPRRPEFESRTGYRPRLM